MDICCKLTNNVVDRINIRLTSVKVHREKNVTFRYNLCGSIDLVCELEFINTRSNGKGAVEYNGISTIDRHLIRNQQTMRVATNNRSSLVIDTTRSNASNLNQFLNVIQPRRQSLILRRRSEFSNLQFVTLQIIRSSIIQDCCTCFCNTKDSKFTFGRSPLIDIYKDIRQHFSARIPILYNTILRSGAFDKLVK